MTFALVRPTCASRRSALGRDRDQLVIAFVEYCFAVPANRYGNAVYSAAQLKTMQEVITLLVFAGFSLVLPQGADRLESSGSALR